MFKSWTNGTGTSRAFTIIELWAICTVACAIIIGYTMLVSKRATSPCISTAYVEHAGDTSRFIVACKGYVKLVPVDASTILIRKDSLQ